MAMILLSFTFNFKLLLTDLVLNRRGKNISSQTHFYQPSSPHCDGEHIGFWSYQWHHHNSDWHLKASSLCHLSNFESATLTQEVCDFGDKLREQLLISRSIGDVSGKLWNVRENIRAGQQLWCCLPWCRSWCGVLLPQWPQVGGGCGAGNKLMAMS